MISAERGRGGPRGVAHRVAARELAGGAADPRRGPAEHGGERRHKHLGEHRHAHEQGRGAHSDREQSRSRRESADEQSDQHQRDGHNDRQQGDEGPETRESRRRQQRALAHAAIGGTRVARSAGRSAASTVISTPTASETTIVRVAKTCAACGRSMPKETNSGSGPWRAPGQGTGPTTDASSPIRSSSSTERRPGGGSRRACAGSPVRACAARS